MSKLIDFLELTLGSGDGAPGSVSFRREKYIPKGGPDGGDGGRGGDVIIRVNVQLNSLSHLYHRQTIKAQDGEHGRGRRKHGKKGTDLLIEVPLGTQLKDSAGNLIKDFGKARETFCFLKGGLGGKGNFHFSTSINQAPTYAQKGTAGKSVEVQLELKLIADLGLVGFPNAGKSTFISVVTNATPKIAAYPFTTLSPNLGIYSLDMESSITIADIPGLLEGASSGTGLGFDFLRHIEHTTHLFFLIDCQSENPYSDFQKLTKELEQYGLSLLEKKYKIGLSKIDSIREDQIAEKLNFFPKGLREAVYPFSSISKKGMDLIRRFGYEIARSKRLPI